jgi:hypothetical protein
MDARLPGGLCSNCYEGPFSQSGETSVIHLTPTDYESWIRTNGPKVEIIDVQKAPGGIYAGGRFPITFRRTEFVVTYRRK